MKKELTDLEPSFNWKKFCRRVAFLVMMIALCFMAYVVMDNQARILDLEDEIEILKQK